MQVMKKSLLPVDEPLKQQYERLRQSLAKVGWISQGSVVDRSKLHPPRSGYQWTRKVKAKTITVALSAEEFKAFNRAIANERQLWKTIQKMEQISRRVLFKNRPQHRTAKPLTNKVLGLI